MHIVLHEYSVFSTRGLLEPIAMSQPFYEEKMEKNQRDHFVDNGSR